MAQNQAELEQEAVQGGQAQAQHVVKLLTVTLDGLADKINDQKVVLREGNEPEPVRVTTAGTGAAYGQLVVLEGRQ